MKNASTRVIYTIATIVNPKEAAKLSKEEDLVLNALPCDKPNVVLNDVIFKFSLEKAQELFKQDSYKQILELYANECSSQASKFQNELRILLEC